MKVLKIVVPALVAALVACGSDNSNNNNNNNNNNNAGFQQPAGTTAVNFTVDDTANKTWKSQELEWKGNVLFDPATRKGTYDSTWGGPWAKLYDDGPWTSGGHEPAGSVAGDHKLGVTVFIVPPATGTQDYEYGLRDATNPDTANGGWVWVGNNGKFTLTAGSTTAVTATGLTFPAHGTIDMKLTLDTTKLDTGATFDASVVQIKGSAWGWKDVTAYDDGPAGGHGDAVAGDKIFTFLLSKNIDQTKPPYPGLLKSGDKPEFVWDLGPAGAVKEYKVSSVCSTKGVAAFVVNGTTTTDVTSAIALTGGTGLGSGNTYITVP